MHIILIGYLVVVLLWIVTLDSLAKMAVYLVILAVIPTFVVSRVLIIKRRNAIMLMERAQKREMRKKAAEEEAAMLESGGEEGASSEDADEDTSDGNGGSASGDANEAQDPASQETPVKNESSVIDKDDDGSESEARANTPNQAEG